MHRMPNEDARSYAKLYSYLEAGALLQSPVPTAFAENWSAANADSF
jgi:hypothetical protein